MEVFILKLIDTMLNTTKTIFIIKNRKLLATLAASCSIFFYMLIIVDFNKALFSAIATAVGTLLSFFIMSKFGKDEVWIFEVIPSDNKKGKDFADKIRELNIGITTYVGFNDSKEKVLCSRIYSQTKAESKMIEDIINHDESFKYHITKSELFVYGGENRN